MKIAVLNSLFEKDVDHAARHTEVMRQLVNALAGKPPRNRVA